MLPRQTKSRDGFSFREVDMRDKVSSYFSKIQCFALLVVAWRGGIGLAEGNQGDFAGDENAVGKAANSAAWVLVVDDSLQDQEAMQRRLGADFNGAVGSMIASPMPGMRRAALLAGDDSLNAGVWGEWAHNLRLRDSWVRNFSNRGVNCALAGVWGLGVAKPFRPEEHGFTRLDGSYLAATADCVSNHSDGLGEGRSERKNAKEWLTTHRGQSVFIYHSLEWGRGAKTLSDAEFAQVWEGYAKLGLRRVLVGGGSQAPIAVEGSEPGLLPRHLPELGAIFEREFSPGDGEHLLRSHSITRGTRHFGVWRGQKLDRKMKQRGLVTFDQDWVLANGPNLFKRNEYGGADPVNYFDQKQQKGILMLKMQQVWWEMAVEAAATTKCYHIDGADELLLTLVDWGPSTQRPVASGWSKSGQVTLPQLIRVARQMQNAGPEGMDDLTGAWYLEVERPGQYELEFRKLPEAQKDLAEARFAAGLLKVTAARSGARMEVMEGATALRVKVDFEGGFTPLEATLSSQSGLENKLLGAFFVKIRRVGDLRLDRVDFEVK